MKPQKFTYPDIPVVSDRQMYDYFFSLDRLVREQGKVINQLIEVINELHKQ